MPTNNMSAQNATYPPAENLAKVVAGHDHACALTTAGEVMCWGRNWEGQLGDGSTTNSLVPVNVSGLNSGVVDVGVGERHSCALLDNGGVKCWGSNFVGVLGTGADLNSNSYTPVDVVGMTSGIKAISVNKRFNCALTEEGGVKCWGHNDKGQLGNGFGGDSTYKSTPVDVTDLSSGVSSIATGPYHTCAALESGGAKCWGHNRFGEAGDGTHQRRYTPVNVREMDEVLVEIAAGESHTCALTVDGVVKCWGGNAQGQIGDGSTTERLLPITISGLGSNVKAIAAGQTHTCALTNANGIKCWGSNRPYYVYTRFPVVTGYLGDGTSQTRYEPVDVVGLTSGVAQISAGVNITCAALEDETAKCWGSNEEGQLGDGSLVESTLPVTVVASADMSRRYTTCRTLSQEGEFGEIEGDLFEIGSSWFLETDPLDIYDRDATFIHVPNGNGDNLSGASDSVDFATYCFVLPRSGEFKLVGLVRNQGENVSEAFYVQVNGEPSNGYIWKVDGDTLAPNFLENELTDDDGPVIFDLNQGEHLVRIHQRQDGAKLDKLWLEPVSGPAATAAATVIPPTPGPTSTPYGYAIQPTPTSTPQPTPTNTPQPTIATLEVFFQLDGIDSVAPGSMEFIAGLHKASDFGGIAIQPDTIDQGGSVTFPAIPPGDYYVTAVHAGSLVVIRPVTLELGENQLDVGPLPTGDINGDNQVTLLDFSVLSAAFNADADDDRFDDRADLNRSGDVTALDFSLLAKNFNTVGDSWSSVE
ncbi:MAG: dockerin type I domain-containing protein [Chloroflexota bacterium]